MVTSLKLSPTILTCSGRSIGLFSLYTPAETLIIFPTSADSTAIIIDALASPNFFPVLLSSPSVVT